MNGRGVGKGGSEWSDNGSNIQRHVLKYLIILPQSCMCLEVDVWGILDTYKGYPYAAVI